MYNCRGLLIEACQSIDAQARVTIAVQLVGAVMLVLYIKGKPHYSPRRTPPSL